MKYKFEDIAINSTAKKLPEPSDNEHYIGLEHLDSGNLYVTRWGAETAPIGEKLLMKKGDVLFGKRRAYQKKVGIAPFDGIFSAHGMVLRPKEDVICKSFFPFFISSDYFLNEAIRISVGGLSPTINWKDLRVLEFELPSLEEQRVLADKLWAAYEVKESYKNLLTQTDKLLHAQFEKMFGDVENTIYDLKDIKSFADCYAGATPSTRVVDYWENGNIPWMSSGEVHQGRVIRTEQYITQKGYDNCSTKMVPKHSIVIALAGQGKTRGTVAVTEIDLCTNQSLCAIIPNSTVLPDYLYYHLKGRYMEIRRLAANADGRGGLNLAIINKIKVIVPPMEKQLEFVSIAEQAEQTKASLNKGIEAIEAVIRSLIAEGTTRV